MPIKQVIMEDIKSAMMSGDKRRLEALRMARARMIEAEVDLRAKMGRDYELPDEEAIKVLATLAKQRKESIESFRKGGREDLVKGEEAELAVLQEYLPEPLDEEELRGIVDEAIAEAGAASPRDMGAVMKILMPRVQGRADGKLVSRLVTQALSGK